MHVVAKAFTPLLIYLTFISLFNICLSHVCLCLCAGVHLHTCAQSCPTCGTQKTISRELVFSFDQLGPMH